MSVVLTAAEMHYVWRFEVRCFDHCSVVYVAR